MRFSHFTVLRDIPNTFLLIRSYFESMRWIHQAGRWERDTPEQGKGHILSFKGGRKPTTKGPWKPRPHIKIWDGLAKECVDAYHHTGRAINTLYEHHKTCEQNRAYAHYRRTK